jgi:hypothetical protein
MLTLAAKLVRWIIASPFVKRAAPLKSTVEIVWWWEQRRLLYNAVVGVIGIGVGAVALVSGLLMERLTGEPVGMPDPPFFIFIAILLYAVVANAAYTLGWAAELIYRKVGLGSPDHFAEFTFTGGLIFSALLTTAPAAVIVLVDAVIIVRHLLR